MLKVLMNLSAEWKCLSLSLSLSLSLCKVRNWPMTSFSVPDIRYCLTDSWRKIVLTSINGRLIMGLRFIYLLMEIRRMKKHQQMGVGRLDTKIQHRINGNPGKMMDLCVWIKRLVPNWSCTPLYNLISMIPWGIFSGYINLCIFPELKCRYKMILCI